jgi:uncharacterized protein YukE
MKIFEIITEAERTFQPKMTPMQELISEYQFFTSMGQMGASDYAKSSDSAEKLKQVTQRLSQDNKSFQNLDAQALERNKENILSHIHSMMNYVIANFKEHLSPERFAEKRQQINSVLTKYNNIVASKGQST